jgi:hypothetical protein
MTVPEYIKVAKVGDVIDTDCPRGLYIVACIATNYIKTISIWDRSKEEQSSQIWELNENASRNFGSCVVKITIYGNSFDETLNSIIKKSKIYKLNNTIMSLQSTIKKAFRQEPEKTFVKVGFMDENENITEEGKEALLFLLWKEKKDEIKKLADTIQAQEKIER